MAVELQLKKNRKSWSQLITTTESYTLGVQRKKNFAITTQHSATSGLLMWTIRHKPIKEKSKRNGGKINYMCKVIQHREAVGEYKILFIATSMKNKRQLIPKNNYPKNRQATMYFCITAVQNTQEY